MSSSELLEKDAMKPVGVEVRQGQKDMKSQQKTDKRNIKRQKKLAKKHEKAQRKAQLKSGYKVRKVPRDRVLDYHGYSNRFTYDELVNAESAIGRTIFGPIPEGHQREFFEYRKNVWIWHESFKDPQGVMQEMTVRYEVRPSGVYKRPGQGDYHKIDGVELDNFRKAARIYLDLIKTKLYY